MVSSPGIDGIADLEGQAIATSGPGGFNGMRFRYMIRQEGLTPEDDVAVMPVGGSSERAAALMAGQVQATIVYIDNWLAMKEQGADVQLLGYVAVPQLSSRDLETKKAGPDWLRLFFGPCRVETCARCWRPCSLEAPFPVLLQEYRPELVLPESLEDRSALCIEFSGFALKRRDAQPSRAQSASGLSKVLSQGI